MMLMIPIVCLNSPLCTLLNIFENSFPVAYTSYRKKNKVWITDGIKISRKRKRSLFVLIRNTKGPQIKDHSNKHCAILRKVIREAKKSHYNTLIRILFTEFL
jgi:hypothetical protein